MTTSGSIIFNMELLVCRKERKDIMTATENLELGRHMDELRNRINACTRDELEIICETIAENNSDIMLGAIYKKIRTDEEMLTKLADTYKYIHQKGEIDDGH